MGWHIVVVFFLSCALLPQYVFLQYDIWRPNPITQYHRSYKQSRMKHSRSNIPGWVVLYKQLEANQKRMVGGNNIQSQTYSSRYNIAVQNYANQVNQKNIHGESYPNPQFNIRNIKYNRLRQPQPLLNKGPLMNYFYSKQQPQYTISIQSRSDPGPKQYISVYEPRQASKGMQLPSLKDLFSGSFYRDVLLRKKNEKTQLKRVTPDQVSGNKKNSLNPPFQISQQLYGYQYPYLYSTDPSAYIRNSVYYPVQEINTKQLYGRNTPVNSYLPTQNKIQIVQNKLEDEALNTAVNPNKLFLPLQDKIQNVQRKLENGPLNTIVKSNSLFLPFQDKIQNVKNKLENQPSTAVKSGDRNAAIKAQKSHTVEKQRKIISQQRSIPKQKSHEIFYPTPLIENVKSNVERTKDNYKVENKKEILGWDKKDTIPKVVVNSKNNKNTTKDFEKKNQIVNSQEFMVGKVRNSTNMEDKKGGILTNDTLPMITSQHTVASKRNEILKLEQKQAFKNINTSETSTLNSEWRQHSRHHIYHPIIHPSRTINIIPAQRSINNTSPIGGDNLTEKREFLPIVYGDEDDDNFIEDDNNERPLTRSGEEDRETDSPENNEELNERERDNDETQQDDSTMEPFVKELLESDKKRNGYMEPLTTSDMEGNIARHRADANDELLQGLEHNIATSRDSPSKKENDEKNISLSEEENEAAKEDKEAEMLMTSKDKFRMDDQPEVLGVNDKGITSAADKTSISTNIQNSLTSGMKQGHDAFDISYPDIKQSFGKHPFTALDDLKNVEQQEQQRQMDGNDIEEFEKSVPQEESARVKSESERTPAQEIYDPDNSEIKGSPTSLELAEKNFNRVVHMKVHDENDDGELDPVNIDSKNDDEKNALLDPVKAQERFFKLNSEREMQKKFKKAKQGEIRDSKLLKEELSAADALRALNGGALPSGEEIDKKVHHAEEHSMNSITSPSEKSPENPVGRNAKPVEEKKDTGETELNNLNNHKEPVVGNASVSKEVVDLLKSLGQIEPKSGAEKQNASTNERSSLSVDSDTVAKSKQHDKSIESEEKETKEAVHDLGIAVSILEKKLALISQAKTTGNKKNIYIVDDSSGNDKGKTQKKSFTKSSIELNNSVSLLEKVINVAERFKKKKKQRIPSQVNNNLSTGEKRDKINKVNSRKTRIGKFEMNPSYREYNNPITWKRTNVDYDSPYYFPWSEVNEPSYLW